jgi:hypothetical protein
MSWPTAIAVSVSIALGTATDLLYMAWMATKRELARVRGELATILAVNRDACDCDQGYAAGWDDGYAEGVSDSYPSDDPIRPVPVNDWEGYRLPE